MRFFIMLQKELKNTRQNLPFHMVTIISPLLFLFAFTIMLSGGLTLPIGVYDNFENRDFANQIMEYKSPSGECYFRPQTIKNSHSIQNSAGDVLILKNQLKIDKNKVEGTIFHYVNDINANMLKNYKNRLNGLIVKIIENNRSTGNVMIEEFSRYKKDIPWAIGFGVSVFVFGMSLSGFLYGMLSMTNEWENNMSIINKLSPHCKFMFLFSKWFSAVLKSCISGLIFTLILYIIFGVSPIIHILDFILTLFLSYSFFVLIGILIGYFVKDSLTSFLISLITALAMWVTGGGFAPLSYFGKLANAVARLNPDTYILEVIRYCYFSGDINLYENLLPVLIGNGAFVFIISVGFVFLNKREVTLK